MIAQSNMVASNPYLQAKYSILEFFHPICVLAHRTAHQDWDILYLSTVTSQLPQLKISTPKKSQLELEMQTTLCWKQEQVLEKYCQIFLFDLS